MRLSQEGALDEEEGSLSEYRERLVPTGSLRILLLVLAVWDFLGGGIQLALHSFLVSMKDGAPNGIMAGRAFSGALFITGLLYLFAAFQPTRYRFILWLAVAEQLVAICTGVFHGARGNVSWGGVILPVAVAIALLILLLLNFPRGLPEPEEEEVGEEALPPGTTSAPEPPPVKQ